MIRSPKTSGAASYIFLRFERAHIGRDYGMGTALRMGPAYFPSLLGALLLLVGAISVIRSFFVRRTPIGDFALKGSASWSAR